MEVKKGNKTYRVPQDYLCKHIPEGNNSTAGYYPPLALGMLSTIKQDYITINVGTDRTPINIQIEHYEHNPVVCFLNDYAHLQYDRTTLEGANQYLSALMALLPFDHFKLLKGIINSICYIVQTKKGLVDVERINKDIEELKEFAKTVANQASNPLVTEKYNTMIISPGPRKSTGETLEKLQTVPLDGSSDEQEDEQEDEEKT